MKDNHKESALLKLSRRVLWGLLAAGLQSGVTHAAVILSGDVGNIPLLGNTANQTVELRLLNTGSDPLQVNGLTFQLNLVNGGGVLGPSITAVDLLTGTPLAGAGAASIAPGGSTSPAFWDLRYVFFSGSATLAANSDTLLATVTFNTTGFANDSWALSLGGTFYNQFGTGLEFFPNFVDGQINVSAVPEPVQLALPIFGGLAVLVGGARRWHRRQARVG